MKTTRKTLRQKLEENPPALRPQTEIPVLAGDEGPGRRAFDALNESPTLLDRLSLTVGFDLDISTGAGSPERLMVSVASGERAREVYRLATGSRYEPSCKDFASAEEWGEARREWRMRRAEWADVWLEAARIRLAKAGFKVKTARLRNGMLTDLELR